MDRKQFTETNKHKNYFLRALKQLTNHFFVLMSVYEFSSCFIHSITIKKKSFKTTNCYKKTKENTIFRILFSRS